MTKPSEFTYVDLFAGCGGLSLGLESEGGRLVTAVERSPMAGETFYHNLVKRVESKDQWQQYLSQSVGEQFREGLVVKELREFLDSKVIISELKTVRPDVVVGGPPCQGFSLAGRRNPDDARNQLPWQFLELVEITSPKVVVIENVVGMRHRFSGDDEGDTFSQLKKALETSGPGYVVQGVEVNALHYGAPQHRPRLMIIGVRMDVASSKGFRSTSSLWRSRFKDELNEVEIPALAPVPTVSKAGARTIGEAIADLQSTQLPNTNETGFLAEMSERPWGVVPASGSTTNHVVRVHTEKTKARFRLYQVFHKEGIDPRILGRINENPDKEQNGRLREKLNGLNFPVSSPDGFILAKNLDEMLELVVELRTKKHSQRVLDWNQPSRTVVTIGDDYVHPIEPRTFTVRELARFQGFPNAFEFRSKETTGGLNRRNEVPQYSQVGNAVSPFLAKAVGKLICRILGD